MYLGDRIVDEMDESDEERDDIPEIAGPPMEVELDQPCISCGRKTVVNTVTNLDLPYLGAAMQTTFICRSCGFRHSDLIALENKGALRHEVDVKNTADLNMRVIRSNSGTIRVPELGVNIEPGLASESFISNAEGVLDRIGDVVSILMKDAELDVHERCTALLGEIEKMKNGELPFHLVIEDPYGNSAIIGDDVKVTNLSDEEVESLQKGEITMDYKPVAVHDSDKTNAEDDGGREG